MKSNLPWEGWYIWLIIPIIIIGVAYGVYQVERRRDKEVINIRR